MESNVKILQNYNIKIEKDTVLLFDMDGTLIDSGTSITNTVNHVRENLGLEKMEKDFILEKVNDPSVNAAEFFYGTKEFTEQQKVLFEE